MRYSRSLFHTVAFSTLLAASSFATSAAHAADKITIMVGGYEKQIYLPAKLAESLGYFKDEGLDVELLNEPAGVDAENQLLAGAVQGVVGFYDHCVDLQAKGKFVESIVQFSQAPGEVELVSSKHPEIKSVADFKGHSAGVTGLGSSTNFLTQYMVAKAGLKGGDVTSVPVGAGTTFIAALQQDAIQVGMTTEPTVSRLLKTKEASVLVDMRTIEGSRKALGGTYPAASLYMETAWTEAHKEETQKLANAFVKTLHFINTHTGAEIAEKMPKDFYVGDKEGYIKALDAGKGMFTADGIMPEDGPKTVLAVLSAFSKNMQGKQIDLSKTYTTEYVKHAQAM
ncbi:ABC transporter substrate-binding protein [Rhizobium leguminosarum]|jgi:NitT/TauT family transport system substrate-binding protein|uniref:ABC transporter substrate-binding protein n=1 Tax=Rhizobium TaxID=379 RepID=UPI00036D7874|nr:MULTISPECIES: ABC transporter substrate-binding protein [Rhizobium]MBY5368561.1 ABC transporter substrate-binding protein [Rhizobium leguminosarum]MBY5403066.1 ABC transporter substrate-binding protein [Rhizobium leguminosarum]MBY5446967.1 ABC transporter substrate-binding protein [Rhizobium leguminosarum]MBY5450444.1 ABC transporter substrate-binding protein [Rhizobium leguminosarum]NNG68696.1 ABC transporter substrate-binding protein [Rhizobium laguerreae]